MEWISVDDKLPEEDVDVLIYWEAPPTWNCIEIMSRKAWKDEENGIDFENCFHDNRGGYLSEDVTHWMPLPNPPEQSEEL